MWLKIKGDIRKLISQGEARPALVCLYVHAEMCAQGKGTQCILQPGKANTCEPLLACLNLSAGAAVRYPPYASRDLNCQALIATKKKKNQHRGDPLTLEETQRGCFPRNSCGIFSALSKGNNLAISAWKSGNGCHGVGSTAFVNSRKVMWRSRGSVMRGKTHC